MGAYEYHGLTEITLNGNDQITVLCTAQDDIVALQPGLLDVDGQTYEIHASNVEVITIKAGSGDDDQVTLHGSAASNWLFSYADCSRLTDSTRSFSYRVKSEQKGVGWYVGKPGLRCQPSITKLPDRRQSRLVRTSRPTCPDSALRWE